MSDTTGLEVPADEDAPAAEDLAEDTGGVEDSDGGATEDAEDLDGGATEDAEDSDGGATEDAEDSDGGATEDAEGDFEDDFDEISTPERVLEVCLRHIVDNPDAIEIDVEEDRRRMTLHVRVAQEDMGKVIGRNGRVANALRTLIKAAGSREGLAATVEIDD